MDNKELDGVIENSAVENSATENPVLENYAEDVGTAASVAENITEADNVSENIASEDSPADSDAIGYIEVEGIQNTEISANEPVDLLAGVPNPDFNPYGRVYDNNLPSLNGLQGPAGLGGWLVLVAIGRILGPLILLNAIYQIFSVYFKSGMLTQLSDPDSNMYSALWKPMAFFELIGNVVLLGLSVLLIVLFFMKKKQFPVVYIGMMILNVIIMLVDLIFIYQIQKALALDLNITATSQLIAAIVTSGVWIPYMLVSKRVKNTFIR